MRYKDFILQYHISYKLLTYLNSKLDSVNGYPDSPSWGYAFTYLSTCLTNDKVFDSLKVKSIEHLKRQNTYHKDYPWEFIVFALSEGFKIQNSLIDHPASTLKSKGTRIFNWYLLRVCLLYTSPSPRD